MDDKMKTNVIIQGDCIKEMKKLPDNSIDLVITDPPYNTGVNYGKSKDKRKNYIKWCVKWIKECERVLKSNGSIYIINYPENNARILSESLKQTNLLFRNWITWHYPTNIGHSPKNYTRSQRSILFYSKGNKFKFNLEEGEVIDDLIRMNLVKNTSKEKVKGFPNQIPEKLIELLVKISSNEKDVVLDPFMGSGTTAVVCAKTDRKYLGIELNPKFIKIANKRLLGKE